MYVAQPKTVNARQLASLLQCSVNYVFVMKRGGKLPPPLRLPGILRWDKDVIAKWIDAGCPVPTNDSGE